MQRGRYVGWVLAWVVTCVPTAAAAVCRIIEPAEGGDDPGVVFDPRTSALYALREEGGTVRVIFAVQPRLRAGPGSAVLLMPVPPGATAERGAPDLFEQIAALARPTVVETITYLEDPSLGWQCGDPHYSRAAADLPLAAPLALYGCGSAESVGAVRAPLGDDAGPAIDAMAPADAGEIDAGATSTDAGTGGELDTPITDAFEMEVLPALDALEAWLADRGFALDEHDRTAMSPYAGAGFAWLTVHVHPDDQAPGTDVALRPIVARWDGEEVRVPEQLQFDDRGGTLWTDLFVLAAERMNLDDGSARTAYASTVAVPRALADLGIDNDWLARLELTRLQHEWKEDPLLVPVAPRPVNAVVERSMRVRIAAACCPDNGVPSGGGLTRTFTETRRYPLGEAPSDDELFFVAPPPPEEYCGGGEDPGPWGSSSTGGGCDDESSPDDSGCDSDERRSGCSGCLHCRCSVSGGPLGGSEPIGLALAWLLVRAARMRRRGR